MRSLTTKKLVILASILVLFTASFAVNFLGNSSLSAKTSRKPIKLYDTHAHHEDEGYAKLFIKQMRKNRVVTTVFLNFQMNPSNPSDSYIDVKDEIKPYPGAFSPFFSIDVNAPEELTKTKLEAISSINPRFKGIGEFALYRAPFQNSSLLSAPWPDTFQFAAEKNLFLMIHLRPGQISELSQMLSTYPNTKVLLHGPEFPNELPSLLQQYSNLYYTLDTATLLWLNGSPIMYPNDNSGRKTFIKKFDRNRKKMLNAALNTWKPVIAAAPDRVMWGTDASFEWHLTTDVYKRLIVFSRDFIKRLPKSQQKPYAYGNALRILGPGAKL